MMEDLTNLIAIAGGLGSVVGAAWVGFKKYSGGKSRKRDENQDVIRAVGAQTKIYGLLQQVLRSTGADRVILLKAHNGGKVIHEPATQIYITVFAEISPRDIPPVQPSFQARAVYDHRYLALLRSVSLNKSVDVLTSHMEEGSMLRSVYESIGISSAIVTEVTSRPGAYWYMSTAFAENNKTTRNDHTIIAGYANQIANVLKKDLFS